MDDAKTLVDLLDRSARLCPERRLHFERGGQISYRELAAESRRAATALRALGARRGCCVGLLVGTSVDFVVSLFGILRSGAAVAPLGLPRGFQEARTLGERLGRLASALDVIVLDSVFATRLSASGFDAVRLATPESLRGNSGAPLADAPTEQDLAVVQYTSGSTSEPRGVALTHSNVLAGCVAIADAMRLTPDDILGAWLPLFHDMGLVGMLAGLLRGVEQYHSAPASFVKDPSAWIQQFALRRATIFTGPNFAYEQLAARVSADELERLDLSAWRVAFNGGEPIDPDCLGRFLARFAPCGFRASSMLPCYGLAEATLAVTFDDFSQAPVSEWLDRTRLANELRAVVVGAGPAPNRKGVVCVGRPVPGMRVEIWDGERRCEEREVGEICISGPSVTRGYYRNPEASAVAVKGGFLHTGDLGYLAQGKLYVTGRRRQMLIVRGENYYPEDIEAAVRSTPGVYQQRCVAIKLDESGESVCILAETKAVSDVQELQHRLYAAARREFPALEFDVRLVAPRSLQQTSSGKFQRLLMRDLVRSGALETRELKPAKPHAATSAADGAG
jgi:acyl-CoA synthetase (AMP-forming)/AMP-acid ligase II